MLHNRIWHAILSNYGYGISINTFSVISQADFRQWSMNLYEMHGKNPYFFDKM